jgi:hypothetical protein
VYIPVSHVYKLACTLYRTINLLPLFHVCPVLPHPTKRIANQEQKRLEKAEMKELKASSTLFNKKLQEERRDKREIVKKER